MAKMTLQALVSQLEKAFGPELRAMVLYGSAAAGEHIPKRSDHNVLVIVESLPVDRLRAAAAAVSAWAAGGSPPPLILTTAEWRSSADIFPMEYADILERHRVLLGEPPFAGIAVSRADLRLQLEFEAMGKLLQLRRGVLAAGGDRARQVELLEASLSAIMVVFRAVVRLHGDRPSADYEALCGEVERRTGVAVEPFVRVVRHVRGTQRLDANAAGETLVGYLDAMQRLVSYLDKYVIS